MPSPGQELSSIDFESMLGGPLIAVVHAQTQAAIATVDFIKTVGFKPGPDNQTPSTQSVGDPIYVDFTYFKEVAPYQPRIPARPPDPAAVPPDPGAAEEPEVAAQYQQQKLSVPILTLLPIPYLRIEDTTIDFKAKIDAVEYTRTDTALKIDASLEAQAGWGWGSAKLKVSASYQRNTTAGENTTRTYSMDVHIHAVQDEMPAGMQRMLSVLESTVQAQPLGAPAPQITDH